jgi:O-antigen/teichoic acid export membrane protein
MTLRNRVNWYDLYYFLLNKLESWKNKLLGSRNLTAIFVLTFWGFASRGLGIVREGLVGRLTPLEADIFSAASTFNEQITTIFILGTTTVALLPQIIKIENDSKITENEKKVKVNSLTSWAALLFSLFISIFCISALFFTKELLFLLNDDLYSKANDFNLLQDYIYLNQVFLIAPIIFAFKTIIGVFLNSKKEYWVYSLDGVLTNLGSIIGLSILYTFFGLKATAWGLVLGFAITLIFFLIDAYKHGFKFGLKRFEGLGGYLILALSLFIPRIFLYSSGRLAELLITNTSTNTGDITIFRLAMNIQGVFYGLMMSVGTVFLPDLASILVREGRKRKFWNHYDKYLNGTFWFSIGATLFTIIISPIVLQLIKILAFVKEDSLLNQNSAFQAIIYLIVAGSVAIIFQAVSEIMNRYFIALEEKWFPIIATVIANIAGLIFTYQMLDILGSPLSVMIGFVLNNIVLTVILALRIWRDKYNSILD